MPAAASNLAILASSYPLEKNFLRDAMLSQSGRYL